VAFGICRGFELREFVPAMTRPDFDETVHLMTWSTTHAKTTIATMHGGPVRSSA
jgi:hypothetical protein